MQLHYTLTDKLTHGVMGSKHTYRNGVHTHIQHNGVHTHIS